MAESEQQEPQTKRFDIKLRGRTDDGRLEYELRDREQTTKNGLKKLDGFFLVDPTTEEIEAGRVTRPSRSPSWLSAAKRALRKYLNEPSPGSEPTETSVAVEDATYDADYEAGLAASWSLGNWWPDEQMVDEMRGEA